MQPPSRPTPRPTTPSPGSCTGSSPTPRPSGDEARPLVHRKGAASWSSTTRPWTSPTPRRSSLVARHWSGKHKRVVRGINLITLVWTDGDRIIPCDYRLYDKAQGRPDQERPLPGDAPTRPRRRGFGPDASLFDSWYSSLENLKAVRGLRLALADAAEGQPQGEPRPPGATGPSPRWRSPPAGTVVHLEGFGSIRVFKIVSRDGDIEYWATNDLAMDELTRLALAERCWAIENYHRGLKQCCGVERCQARVGAGAAQPHRAGDPGVPAAGAGTSTPPGSVGTRPRPGSSATRSGPTRSILCTNCHDRVTIGETPSSAPSGHLLPAGEGSR